MELGNDMCRACLGVKVEMISLFNIENNSQTNLLDMFISCTSLETTENDEYPKHICKNCIEELSTAFAFRIKCQNSIDRLNKINEDLKSVVNIEVDVSIVKDDPDEFTIEEQIRRNEEMGNKPSSNEVASEFLSSVPITGRQVIVNNSYSNTKTKSNGKNEKLFTCKFCDKTFCKRRFLTEHKKTHNIIRTCRRCNIYFESVQAYKNHLRSHEEYLCPDCGHVCKSRSGFKAHIQSHSNERPNECKICGKRYKSSSALKVHNRYHTGEQPYTCEHCDKKFTTWNTKSNHILYHHSDARPHVCNICNSSFKTSTNLTIHKRQHTGERPYQCPKCPKTFSSASLIKRHIATHTGEKPIACPICPKRFGRRCHLKQHMITHTGERKHGCEVCGRTFTQAHVLRSHMNTHCDSQGVRNTTNTKA